MHVRSGQNRCAIKAAPRVVDLERQRDRIGFEYLVHTLAGEFSNMICIIMYLNHQIQPDGMKAVQ